MKTGKQESIVLFNLKFVSFDVFIFYFFDLQMPSSLVKAEKNTIVC